MAKLHMGSLFTGVIVSGAIVLLGVALISVLVALTDWDGITPVITAMQISAVALGGFISGRIAQTTGWLHGGLVGLFYRVLTAFAASEGLGSLISLNGVWWSLLAFLTGAVGGVVGVNATGRRTQK